MTHEPERTESDARGLGKDRIETLADGIFAVAMTLLVLDIKAPAAPWLDTNRALVDHLAILEHSFAMYVISFFVLAIFWIAHHTLFHFVRHMDRRLLWINLGFLLLVTCVPFSTDLIGDHGHLSLPVLVYGANLLALGALLLVHLRYLVVNPHLAASDLTAETVTHMRREIRLYALIPLASITVSFYSPRLGMYLYLLLAIPAFSPSRLDRLTRPAATVRPGQSSDDS
jgi:TMEM175 potassium channel family protein